MDKEQRKYAMQRVEQAVNLMTAAIRAKYTTIPKEVSAEQKLEAIRNGDFNLLPGVTLSTPIGKAFKFHYLKPEPVADEERIEAEIRKIKVEAGKIKDDIMLGEDLSTLNKLCERVGNP